MIYQRWLSFTFLTTGVLSFTSSILAFDNEDRKNPTSHEKNELGRKIPKKDVKIRNNASLEWQENCNKTNWTRSNGCHISGLLRSLLSTYDKRLRPLMDEQRPVTVIVGFWILSIDSINVIDMDYQIDFFFRQQWYDPRLRHAYRNTLTVSNAMLDRIWVPDTYFENSKNSYFHEVTVPNKMLKIKPDGTILYNARISVKASCPMDLRMFPMDVQECALNIESYGYSDRDITFQWEKNQTRISIGKKVRTLPQYNLTGFRTSEKLTEYVVGNWSGLTAIFVLERRTGYFFLHLYAPCALIVMISWISFCIPKDATAARVALGITSVLTITTILNMLNTAMPKVSYIKAVDWYLIVSFLFVFAVLIEYTFVLYLTDRDKQFQKHEKKKKKRKKDEKSHKCNRHYSNGHVQSGKYDIRLRSAYSVNSNTMHKETTFYEESDDENGSFLNKPVIVVVENNNKNYTNENIDRDNDNYHEKASNTNICCQFRIDCIDEYSRMIFPLSFIAFNIIYWLLFFSRKYSNSEN